MIIREIVKKWMNDNGYKNLINSEFGCICNIDNLFFKCSGNCSESCRPINLKGNDKKNNQTNRKSS